MANTVRRSALAEAEWCGRPLAASGIKLLSRDQSANKTFPLFPAQNSGGTNALPKPLKNKKRG